MKTVILSCDNCGRSDTPDKMKLITVSINLVLPGGRTIQPIFEVGNQETKNVEWCFDCIGKIIPTLKPHEQVPEKPKSLLSFKDFLRLFSRFYKTE